MERMNREMTEELCLTEAYVPMTDFSEIAWASYELEIMTEGANAALAEQMERLLTTSPLHMIKKTKAGEKEIDIVSMIHSVSVSFDAETGKIKIIPILKATSTEFLNPEMLISAMKRELGILSGDPMKEWYTILRTSVMDAKMKLFR